MGDVDLTETEIEYLQGKPPGFSDSTGDQPAKGAESAESDKVSKKPDDDEADDDDEWLDVLGSGALKKKILTPGNPSSERPEHGMRCCMEWSTMLMDGTLVDGPSEGVITLGDCDVVQAIDMVSALMAEGERAIIESDSRFAYGDKGRGCDIPPKARLQFNVHLKQFLPALEIANMSTEEKVAEGTEKKKRGNELFSYDQYSLAVRSYKKALFWLDNEEEKHKIRSPSQEIQDLQVVCYTNLAQAYLKMEQLSDALDACTKALLINPNSTKALYRAAKVSSSRGDYSESVRLLQRALTHDPGSKTISQDLQIARSKVSEQNKAEKALYRRMVSSQTEKPSCLASNERQSNTSSSKTGGIRWLWAGAAVALVSAIVTAAVFHFR